MPIATDFASPTLLNRHYAKHKDDFGAASESDYLNQAKSFLNTPLAPAPEIEERQRKRGGVLVDEWVRYNKTTNEFAVVYTDGTIGTYFKPMMESAAPPGTPRSKTHRRSSNYQYFLDECEK